jgi:tetratricopeptide (TPR) repeat protein
VAALESRAYALRALGRRAEALAAYEQVLGVSPGREQALAGAAVLCQELSQHKRALGYWRRAVAANPWRPPYLRNLAVLLAEQEAWDELRPHVESWRRLDPGSVEARVLWIRLLVREGRRAEAREEFARVRALRPANLADLEDWFERLAR